MLTSSRKAKGRTLQQLIVTKILERFTSLTPRDVQSTSMGASGVDVKLSAAAYKLLPLAIEAKCQEVHAVFIKHWQQTEENVEAEGKPVLVIKSNRLPVLAVLKLDDFLDLVKK